MVAGLSSQRVSMRALVDRRCCGDAGFRPTRRRPTTTRIPFGEPGRVGAGLRERRALCRRPLDDARALAGHVRRAPSTRSSNIARSSRTAAGARCPRGARLKLGSNGARRPRAAQAARRVGRPRRLVGRLADLRFLRRCRRQALPGAPRLHRERRGRPRRAGRDEHAGRHAAAPARDQPRPPQGLLRQSRLALRDGQHSRPNRSRRSRMASSPPTIAPASAASTASRPSCRRARSTSTSTRIGTCRNR